MGVAAPVQAALAKPSHFSVTIDTSGAELVLAAALANPTQAAADADAALANPSVQAMIAKMAKYDKAVTPNAFRAAVMRFAGGGSGEPFDLERVRNEADATRRILTRLKTDGAVIAARVASRLQSFTPDGLDVHARLFILVGAKRQNGWVPDQTVPNLYVDLGFHGEEVDSVVNIAAHELFHVVQNEVQPNYDAAFADRRDLPPDARELHRAHAVLMNLLLEGTATYVGDASLYPNAGPHLAQDQREMKRELGRIDEVFALFDTILFRARRDPDAKLDPLLDIGFGGPWDETGYFVGYRMAKTIDKYASRARLRALIALPPEDFVAEYIAIATAHPDDPEITPLAPSSMATVAELQQLGDKRP